MSDEEFAVKLATRFKAEKLRQMSVIDAALELDPRPTEVELEFAKMWLMWIEELGYQVTKREGPRHIRMKAEGAVFGLSGKEST